MKKWMVLFLMCICMLGFAGCGKGNSYEIQFTVPAGSTGEFIFSEEEISATGRKITISSNQELGDAQVILAPVNDFITPGYVATYVTPGMPASFDASKGEWFKVGLAVKNASDAEKIVYVTVSGVEIRID